MNDHLDVAPPHARRGHRVRGAFSGLSLGLGLVILLQEFAIVPLTTLVLLLVPLGTVLIGLAVGWPRAPRAT